jgi:hypothetical protein
MEKCKAMGHILIMKEEGMKVNGRKAKETA